MSDPVTLMGELNDLAARLDTASRALYGIEQEFDGVAEEYEDVFDDLLVTLLDEYEADDKRRLPGEDVRNALIRKQIRDKNPALYGKYRRLKHERDRGDKRAKRIEREIGAKQSILSFLKVEAQATA